MNKFLWNPAIYASSLPRAIASSEKFIHNFQLGCSSSSRTKEIRLRFHENRSNHPQNNTSFFLIKKVCFNTRWPSCHVRSYLNTQRCTWTPENLNWVAASFLGLRFTRFEAEYKPKKNYWVSSSSLRWDPENLVLVNCLKTCKAQL